MANVIIRFSIYSKTTNPNDKLNELLPEPDEFTVKGDLIMLASGVPSRNRYQETAYSYTYQLNDITDIEDCNSKWLKEWESKLNLLKELEESYGFYSELNYEVTVFDNNFPSIYYQPNFLEIIGKANVVLSLYFYLD